MAGGIIFRSLLKNSASSSSNSHSFLSLPVLTLCSVTLLYFSSIFFHLLELCSHVTLTDEYALKALQIYLMQLFFVLNAIVEEVGFFPS